MAKDRVEAVEKALELLNAFSEENSELTLKNLADATGLYKSTILRLASSLMRYQYLSRQENGVFRIGPSFLKFAEIYRKSLTPGKIIRPVLKEIRDELNESVAFYVKHGEFRICAYRINSNQAISHQIQEGVQLPLDQGASGRILTAFDGGNDKLSLLIKQQGWYLSQGERDPDVAALSVPVLSPDAGLHGALSVSGLESRFTDDFQQKALPLMLDKAGELGRSLIYSSTMES